ncbi:lysogenization protein HflD [Salinisphaera aquimarina]|uniref:Lysogenization protein HflD n=1 Tax=Salinisphaera aquimarina TaxID=2094031 RepID=A0ABV7ERX4_9GAMM
MSDNSSHTLRDQALALAGVAQFALYAHELGADGRDEPERINAARHAIFCTDPDTVMDVYGDLPSIGDGIAFLKAQLAGQKPDQKAALVARYIGQLLRLSGNLLKNDAALRQIRGAIDRARLAEADDVPGILDDAYRNSISPVKPRIMLHGHPTYLGNDLIQARARTQLMAAVRCAILWRQCGGGFITLFFRRKALLKALETIGPTASAS